MWEISLTNVSDQCEVDWVELLQTYITATVKQQSVHYSYIVNTSTQFDNMICRIRITLEGARASTGLCVDVGSGVMI